MHLLKFHKPPGKGRAKAVSLTNYPGYFFQKQFADNIIVHKQSLLPWSTILTQWNLSKRKLRKGNMCRPCVLSLMKNRHLLLFYSVVKRILRQWSKDCNSHRLVLEKLAKMSEWLWRNVTRIFMLSAHFQTPLYTRPSLKPSLFHLACFLLWVQLLQQPHS